MKATRTWELILVFLLLIVVAGFSATTEGFLDFYNLSHSTFNYSEKALIALVMALVIIAGEIDISVAATVALTESYTEPFDVMLTGDNAPLEATVEALQTQGDLIAEAADQLGITVDLGV